jgi:hypothetical protein
MMTIARAGNHKGTTQEPEARTEKVLIRISPSEKKLLADLAKARKEKGLRYCTMTDVLLFALKEYAINHPIATVARQLEN